MFVKIIKCKRMQSGKRFWYHEKVGQTFRVYTPEMSENYYIIKNEDNTHRSIWKTDCIQVRDPKAKVTRKIRTL